MDDRDYLQDPEMWEDKLPQPYKTINRILRDILKDTLTRIEEREVMRRREEARVKIPSGADGVLLCKKVLMKACGGIECGEDSVVVVCNGMSVCALRYHWTNSESPQQNTEHSTRQTGSTESTPAGHRETVADCEANAIPHAKILNEMNVKHSIIRLTAVQKKDGLIIMVQFDKGIKILALFGGVLTAIADITYLHKEKPSKILKFTLSPSCTHLAVSYHCPPQSEDSTPTITTVPRSAAVSSKNSGKGASAKTGIAATPISTDDAVIIALYSLPADDWISELHKSMELNDKTQDLIFPKSLVLYYIPSPLALVPSSASNPAAIFQSVCDEKSQTLPSGDLHCLTEQYFENRWKHFVWKRQEIMPIEKRQVPESANLTKQFIPTCHFLYYKNRLKQDVPCEVAVWWEDHSQLIIYPVKEGGKLATLPPTKRIPQASSIICSSCSTDSSLLALGLKSGVVAVWNMKTNFSLQVISCTKPPDQITAFDFFCDRDGNDHLGVGSKLGKLLDVNLCQDICQPSQSVTSFTARISKQQQTYGDLFASNEYNLSGKLMCFITDPHYPKLLISLQDDGCVVFWNPSESEALCKFELSSNGYILNCPPQYSITKNGRNLLLLVKKVDSEDERSGTSHLLCLDIFSVPQLVHFWEPGREKSPEQDAVDVGKEADETLLKPTGIFLDKYTKSRYVDASDYTTKWKDSWTKLSNYLLQQT